MRLSSGDVLDASEASISASRRTSDDDSFDEQCLRLSRRRLKKKALLVSESDVPYVSVPDGPRSTSLSTKPNCSLNCSQPVIWRRYRAFLDDNLQSAPRLTLSSGYEAIASTAATPQSTTRKLLVAALELRW